MRTVVETLRPDEAAWDLFVFRKARESLCGEDLKQQLLGRLRLALAHNHRDGLLNCLIRAGDLECALADAASPQLAPAMQAVDALAAATLQPEFEGPWLDLLAAFSRLQLPPTVFLSPAEGFSYYGLHPLDFWDLAQQISMQRPSAAVIGIRSIGTTLSSIVCRSLHCRGRQAERITVRPAGPPYQRRLQFSPAELQWVRERLNRDSEFLVVDEGPGFSGSSFTSVGRALRQAGVPGDRILLMGSRHPQSAELSSRFDPEWNSFRFCSVVQGTHVPSAAKTYCSGGIWRQHRFADVRDWPACWTQLERTKYFSADGRSLFKFEGFGRYGEAVYQRAQQLAHAGFAAPALGYDNGFVEYATVFGDPMSTAACSPSILQRLARYCAFRVAEHRASAPGPVSLDSMLALNLRLEFGLERSTATLPLEKLVVADSRMMPHEWVAAGGQLMKTDGASHGDDHLFPGPTDIAWDLAGVIAEWNLSSGQQEFFLREYQRYSGDNAASRLPAYLLAYSVFRMACCRMGAAAMAAEDESFRLEGEYRRHRAHVVDLLGLNLDERHDPRLLLALPGGQAA